jgi:hypothetical protein
MHYIIQAARFSGRLHSQVANEESDAIIIQSELRLNALDGHWTEIDLRRKPGVQSHGTCVYVTESIVLIVCRVTKY